MNLALLGPIGWPELVILLILAIIVLVPLVLAVVLIVVALTRKQSER